MKERLKLKIAFTNIRRIIMSFLFINLAGFFQKNVKGAVDRNLINKIDMNSMVVTCYLAGPTEKVTPMSVLDKIINYCQENVFILLVPIALVILLILFIIKNIKRNKELQGKKEEKNDKQD